MAYVKIDSRVKADTDAGILIKKLAPTIESLVDHIVSGGCKSFEDYKEACGRINGLRLAINEIETLEVNHVKAENN